VDFFDDIDSLNVTLDGMIASYCKPLYNADKKMVAVISTDLSLYRLSKIITQEKPYPHSYYMMLGEGGHFLIHPDSTRLFTQTVFDNADPRQQVDVIALGHEMTAGNSGNMSATIDGIPCQVCYQHVSGTPWSLAIVCPEDDILDDYHRLVYIILSVLAVGLLVILVLCYRMVGHAIRPLNQLLDKTQSVIDGNMDVHIPSSPRVDAAGRLQNSFATMQESIDRHISDIEQINAEMERRNRELALANEKAEEANKQKAAFIQNMTHQIRTPLNIIMGFSQVLRDNARDMTADDVRNVMEMMKHNAMTLNRMILMLYDSSDSGLSEELSSKSHDVVACNEVARQSINFTYEHFPNLHIDFKTSLPDTFTIHSNELYLMRSLREILYNAAKYSDGQHITLLLEETPSTVRYTITDTGKGITDEFREQVFVPFLKVDDLTEGLGLGLPLAMRHIKNLGGKLTLDPDYHDGCRFVVELPKEG
jgi:signal transduction histidine kinase